MLLGGGVLFCSTPFWVTRPLQNLVRCIARPLCGGNERVQSGQGNVVVDESGTTCTMLMIRWFCSGVGYSDIVLSGDRWPAEKIGAAVSIGGAAVLAPLQNLVWCIARPWCVGNGR